MMMMMMMMMMIHPHVCKVENAYTVPLKKCALPAARLRSATGSRRHRSANPSHIHFLSPVDRVGTVGPREVSIRALNLRDDQDPSAQHLIRMTRSPPLPARAPPGRRSIRAGRYGAAILLHCVSADCLSDEIGIFAAAVRQACLALLSAALTFALLVVI